MPHVIVKLYPGRTEEQKTKLADEIVKDGNNLVMVIALENLWIMMYFSCISEN